MPKGTGGSNPSCSVSFRGIFLLTFPCNWGIIILSLNGVVSIATLSFPTIACSSIIAFGRRKTKEITAFEIKRRMMKKLLTLILGTLLAVTLLGCQDPHMTQLNTESQRLKRIVENDLRHGLAAYLPTSQPKTFYPAP